MGRIRNYLSLIKFSHTIFAMPFALIGFALGLVNGSIQAIYGTGQWNLNQSIGWDKNPLPRTDQIVQQPDTVNLHSIYSSDSMIAKWLSADEPGALIIRYLGLVILCMIFARSAAMSFNRYLDRRFDALNPRTAIREIPSGIINPRNALFFTVVCSALFIATTFFINRICFFLSPVALLVVLGYSYTKRFTALCHLVLGLGLSLAPIGAYLAVTGTFALLPILFSLAVLFWVSGFDIIYALQDEEFDKSQQLYSIPAWLGKKKALMVSSVLHVISASMVIIAGWYGEFGWLYWCGVAVFAGMLVYQHSLVKPDDLKRVNIAFMTANGIASVVFAIFVIADRIIFAFN